MNNVVKFIERQYGKSNEFNYDFVFNRLRPHISDCWKGIIPSDYGADFNPEPPIFSAKFCNVGNYKHILAIANEDGKIAIQNTDKGNENNTDAETSLEGEQCHYNAVFDLEWMPNHMKFVSASGDHTASLWNITESKIVLSRVFMGHTRSVKTATFRRQDPAVFATGGRDGAILIWDTRAPINTELTSKADNCIYSGHSGGSGTPQPYKKKSRTSTKLTSNVASSSITGLAFRDDNTLVSCGAGDGILKVWDLRRNYSCYKKEPQPKFSYPYPGLSTFKGYTSLLIDNSGLRLYVNCMDSKIYCYNLGSVSNQPIQQYSGLKISTFYIKSCLSPDDKYLISGSSDEKAYIWNVNFSQPLVALNGHTVEVTCAAWSQTSDMRIVTCSDDARHKIWRVYPECLEGHEKQYFRGKNENLTTLYNNRNEFKNLEYTPRSTQRLIEQNERTPTTAISSKIGGKRTFSDMMSEKLGNLADLEDNAKQIDSLYQLIKRPITETKGRRLFAESNPVVETSGLDEKVIEESSPPSSIFTTPTRTMPSSSIRTRNITPLMEKINYNARFSSPDRTASSPSTSVSTMHYTSPTSNLPNFILNGEAPHLRITSPKRKLKENVDWLTKIRKQKLSSSASKSSSLIDKQKCLHVETDFVVSPRIQSLKSEFSPRVTTTSNVGETPKRRKSRSNSNSDVKSPMLSNQLQSKESILKFFTITSPVSPANVVQGSSNSLSFTTK